jgi:hypothetical protein
MPITATTTVIDDIPYDYAWDGIPFAYNVQGFSKGESRDDVPWGSSDAFANLLMGIGTYTSSIVGWPVPKTYPDNPALYCLDVRMVAAVGAPRATLTGGFAATQCRYAASFRRPRFDVSGAEMGQFIDPSAGTQPFLEIRKHVGMQDVVIPGASVKVAGGGEPVTRDQHLEEPVIERDMTRWWLPYFPPADLDDLIGSLNNATLWGYPRGRLKFYDYNLNRSVDVSGTTIQQIQLVVQIRKRDWNSVWSDTPAGGFKLLDSTTPIYPYADLSGLLSLTS